MKSLRSRAEPATPRRWRAGAAWILIAALAAALTPTAASAGRCAGSAAPDYEEEWERIYRELNAEWTDPSLIREIDRGTIAPLRTRVTVSGPEEAAEAGSAVFRMLQQSAGVLEEIGARASAPWELEVVLYDQVRGYRPEIEDPETGELVTSSTPAWFQCGDDEPCSISILREGWALPEIELRHIVAHEFFHFVQHVAAPPITSCANLWWKEGTADWFAHELVPGSRWSEGWLRHFNRLSIDTPLTHMTYEAQAFFFWAAERYRADYPLSLAAFGHDGLKDTARVASSLPPEAWQDFLETLVRGELRYPDGRPALPDPYLGEVVREPRKLVAPLLAFARARFELPAGKGDVTLDGNTPFALARQDGVWSAHALGPADLDHQVSCPGPALLPVAAVGLEGSQLQLQVEDRRGAPCCLDAAPRDHCIVGTWEAISTDAPERYGATAPAGSEWTDQDMGENRFVFRPDGGFEQRISRPSSSRFRHRMPNGVHMRQHVTVTNVVRGRWSAANDDAERIQICRDEFAGEMTNQVMVGGTPQGAPNTFPIPYDEAREREETEYRFECRGDRGTVTLLLAGVPPLSWEVRRASATAPRPAAGEPH